MSTPTIQAQDYYKPRKLRLESDKKCHFPSYSKYLYNLRDLREISPRQTISRGFSQIKQILSHIIFYAFYTTISKQSASSAGSA